MDTEPGANSSATADDDELDPTEAVAILAQATRQAKRQFDPTPPWLDLGTSLAIMSAGAICAYAGPIGVWLAIGISVFVIVCARAAILAWRERPEAAR